ncbi:uncharacterized protein ARMOST_21589 [Armillaria ostoyae]|uniref:Uncharacterized protein n=1 Tax=Armillaria ostoyae TaxID=47428 RepID=A0A284SAH1_ARMOS|nr:uncharacterized protein ARMOST_21589 [Armillaria ostoyae]
MDEHYNSKAASELHSYDTRNNILIECHELKGDALQTYIDDGKEVQLYNLATKPLWLSKASTMSIDNNRMWRMVKTAEDNQLEEIVFTVQGVLAKKDLPPVNDAPLRDNYMFLQQHIRITGLGCEGFNDAADNILEAQLVFERKFPEGTFERWTPDNMDGCIGIDISNRYLETSKAYPQEQASFEKGVDLKGILAAACMRRDLLHTEDNKVRFFSSSIDEDGERRFEGTEPQIFRIGDILEVQLSIIAVALKNGQKKLKLKLQSVALLDEGFSKERERTIHCKNVKEKAEQKGRNKQGEEPTKTSSYCSEIIVTINMNLKKAIGSVWRRVIQASAKVAKKFKRKGIYDAWNARTPQQVFRQQRGVAMYFDDD